MTINRGKSVSDKSTKLVSGFTIAEVLIALAITGIILAAAAVAFNASLINYCENEAIFKTTNSARQTLFRMTTQLRTATAVDFNSPPNECSLITADGQDITFSYNSTDEKIYLVTNDDLSDSDYVLCNNVTAATFEKTTFIEGTDTYVKSVQISLTVYDGDFQKTMSCAVVIRRNLN